MNRIRRIRVVLLSVVAACILILVTDTLARRISAYEQIDLLAGLRRMIVLDYVEDPDQEELMEAAARGMVDSLDDPYTVYLNHEEMESFNRQVTGGFSGIGAEVTIKDGHLQIVTPLEDSPAWKAGVMAGDIVLEIDHVLTGVIFNDLKTDFMKLREAVDRLTGEEGTQVILLVRNKSGKEQVIEITRAWIDIPTIKGVGRDANNSWQFMLDEQRRIGYVRITQFTTKTAEVLHHALDQLRDQGTRGLILDVRFNPGGLLESAVAVSDLFLDGDQRIVSIKGRNVLEQVEESTTGEVLAGIPIVVLANEYSASASEIVTGALSDNGRAKFIGARTFGKGSVQQLKLLENNMGGLKMTNAHYYLPNGRNIHRRPDADVWGVDPEEGFYVPMSSDQIEQMVKVRREGDVLRVNNEKNMDAAITPEWIENELGDPQLAAAMRALAGKLETADWPIIGESGIAELARQQNRENLIRRRDRINDALAKIQVELAKLDGDVDEDTNSDSHDSPKTVDKEDVMDQPIAADRVGDDTRNVTPSDQLEQPVQQEAERTEPVEEPRLPQPNEFPTESP